MKENINRKQIERTSLHKIIVTKLISYEQVVSLAAGKYSKEW